MKTSSILLFFLFIASCSPSPDIEEKTEIQPPNILFILVDDLGWGDLGTFYQNQRAEAGDKSNPWQLTPNLDDMANQGVMLTDHYCNAPVCAPSRASFLLGVHQGHSNVRDNQFDKALANNYTVGNVMQEAGYHTVAIGKWGLQGDNRWGAGGDEWPGHPLNRGFDEFYGYMRHRDGHEHYPVEGIYRGEKEVYHDHENVAAGLAKSYTGDLWTAFAKKWIVDHNKENQKRPFFMFLAYDTPHAVIELPSQEYPEGGGVDGGMQWIGEPGHMINTASGEVDSWVHPDYANATWDHDQDSATAEVPWPETYKRFATVNRRIDDAIGDVRQLLRDLNMEENTMVIFTSDNGPSRESYLPDEYAKFTPEFFRSYGPFDGIKRDLWEGGVRVPAIVTWPDKLPQDTVNHSPVMMSDWLATFCDAAGMEVPARSDGESLLHLLNGKEAEDKSPVYVEYFQNGKTPDFRHFLPDHKGRKRGQMQLIRLGDMVGVRYDIKSHRDDFEIYNVVDDPQQSKNLADEVGYEDLQEKMKDQVLRMRITDTSAMRPYDEELIPSVGMAMDRLNEGLRVSWYNTDSRWIPRTDPLQPTGKAVIDNVAVPFDAKGNLMVFKGFLEAQTNGAYTFQLNSPEQIIIRIHDALAVDGDYRAGSSGPITQTLRLEAGLHPIRIYIKNDENESWDFDLKVKEPSGSGFMAISDEQFYH